MSNTKIIGHRGASHDAPQNMKSAFELAIAKKADGVETDLHITRDGQIVVHHDYFIDTHSDGTGCIEFMDLAELKALRFNAKEGDPASGETLLTLAEMLAICRDMEIINLELKFALNDREKLVKTVLEEVEKSQLKENIIFSSFDPVLLELVKQTDPSWKVGLLTGLQAHHGMRREMALYVLTMAQVEITAEMIERINHNPSLDEQVAALSFTPEYLHPDYRSVLADEDLVARMREQGIGVNPYTVNEPQDLRKLAELGCNAVITDRPDFARETIYGTV